MRVEEEVKPTIDRARKILDFFSKTELAAF
jgi:hypothetical protein